MTNRFWFAASLLLAALLFAGSVRAEVKLPRVFSDHMVLQQKQANPIWGWADKGEEVTITLGDAKLTAKADDNGRWSAKLPALAAGGPHKLTVAGKGKEITISDILVGEVWVCSGQSNMEWSVAASLNPQEEAKNGDHPMIRMFTVAKNPTEKPQDDCNGQWDVCSPQTVSRFSAVGYYFARKLNQDLQVPVGMVHTSWGGTICEAWTSKEALEAESDFKPIVDRGATFKKDPNQATNLFDGMVNPLIPYGIKGAIWYQGESNLSRAAQYHKLFPTMIGDWRKRWGQGDFPFLFVQLAPYRYGGQPVEHCAELWASQLHTLKTVPNTGMAVTTDITTINDIHPKNKQDVGKRLALWALAKTYEKKDLVYSGPIYDSAAVEGGKIRVKFQHVGGGLVARGDKPLSHFTIAGEDGKFVPAEATIDGDSVLVSAKDVAKPASVRFAWNDTAEPNFFNKEGLPASPFRTDSLPLLTEKNK